MKAVNLIPEQIGSAARGRAGAGAYALLAALAVLVAMAAAYTLTGRTLATKRAELATVQAQASSAEATAAKLKSYTTFSDLRKARVETVHDLAASRFDWSHAFDEVARTIPAHTWLKSLRATINPAVAIEGTADPLRASLPGPALELTGCSSSQSNVARTVVELRRIEGVQRVSLSNSAKEAATSGGAEGTGDNQTCGSGPAFSATVFFSTTSATTSQSAAATTGGTTP
jgi:Tfp pilus assembly protein PilN